MGEQCGGSIVESQALLPSNTSRSPSGPLFQTTYALLRRWNGFKGARHTQTAVMLSEARGNQFGVSDVMRLP